MTSERLIQLIDRYLTEELTDPEREELAAALEDGQWATQAKEIIHDFLRKGEFNYQPDLEPLYVSIAAAVKAENKHQGAVRRIHFLKRFRWAAAAVLILAIAGTVFLLNPKHAEPTIARVQNDIKAPDKNKATITLPNGKTILLDTVPNGTLIAGIARKTADGRLVFEGNASEVAYIIASNPRNSKAMYIELPDQSQVWLNADSRIQYPTNYNEKDRLVTLNGEAYFEVKHNVVKPFRVTAGEQTIEDVGTSFNVKAYSDENLVKTTLLEGIVKVNHTAVLDQQGQQYANGKILKANIDEVMAWKNGSFYLDGRELGTVASELGRWYDVEVVFNNPDARHSIVFGGEMGRSLSLLQVMEVLKELKVNCRLEDKKLIIE